MKTIGIFTQTREFEGRVYNNLSPDYVRSVEHAGAFTVIVPAFSENVARYIEICDAFIFSGGADIDPRLYGKEVTGAHDFRTDFDTFLLTSMRKVFESGKPIFGICKGMQLLNIAHGGTLVQDLKTHSFHMRKDRPYDIIHTVDLLETDCFLRKTHPHTTLEVNSIHHQAVDILGEGLRIVARSSNDKVVEAIEHMTLPHYGVQWHPEHLANQGLFKWFVGL